MSNTNKEDNTTTKEDDTTTSSSNERIQKTKVYSQDPKDNRLYKKPLKEENIYTMLRKRLKRKHALYTCAIFIQIVFTLYLKPIKFICRYHYLRIEIFLIIM